MPTRRLHDGEVITVSNLVDKIIEPGLNNKNQVRFYLLDPPSSVLFNLEDDSGPSAGGAASPVINGMLEYNDILHHFSPSNASSIYNVFQTAWARGVGPRTTFSYTFTGGQAGGKSRRKTRRGRKNRKGRKGNTRKH